MLRPQQPLLNGRSGGVAVPLIGGAGDETASPWAMSQVASSTAANHSDAYTRAVIELNGLQTDASVVEQARAARASSPDILRKRARKRFNLDKMRGYLERSGLTLEELNNLNIIHVAGTKGKGSVSAMCESILRAHGLKTGFYSSPHLIEVRERIRINGRPISKADFVSAFWTSYDKLKASVSTDSPDRDMPSYFRMLTVMAFHVFLNEKVDVAVIEVGMGGTHDSTNIVAKPIVCAITSLGYDHTRVLGDTIEEIAWHKAGIMKPGRPVFTLPQLPEALKVLRQRAKELNASSIHIVSELTAYPGKRPTMALSGKHQLLNGSLAAQVCREWLKHTGHWVPLEDITSQELLEGIPLAKVFDLPPAFHEGLRTCRWLGRNEIWRKGNITYFLDGAHTPGSIRSSAEWFVEAAQEEACGLVGPVCRVLLFNITRNRDPTTYLTPLLGCRFDYALFTPNIPSPFSYSPDTTNCTVTIEAQYATVAANEQVWMSLCAQAEQQTCHTASPRSSTIEKCSCTFCSIREALAWLSQGCTSASPPDTPALHTLSAASRVQVLVTGSLHLVGDVMRVLGRTAEDV